MKPVKDLKWRMMQGGELALRLIQDKFGYEQFWICHRGDHVVPVYTVGYKIDFNTFQPKGKDIPIYERVAAVLGPLDPYASLASFEGFGKSLLEFTRSYGLPRAICGGQYHNTENRTGQVVDKDGFFGVMPVDEWLDWGSRVRAALMWIKLASLSLSENAYKKLEEIVWCHDPTRARFPLAEVDYQRPVLPPSEGYYVATAFEPLEQVPKGPPVKMAVAKRALDKLAVFAASQLVAEGLRVGVKADLAWQEDPKRCSEGIPSGCWLPQYSAKNLAGETWLQLSNRLANWPELRVCELSECSNLFHASKRGGKDREKRFCCEKCKRRANYLRAKEATDG